VSAVAKDYEQYPRGVENPRGILNDQRWIGGSFEKVFDHHHFVAGRQGGEGRAFRWIAELKPVSVRRRVRDPSGIRLYGVDDRFLLAQAVGQHPAPDPDLKDPRRRGNPLDYRSEGRFELERIRISPRHIEEAARPSMPMLGEESGPSLQISGCLSISTNRL
jgi:hypothetical protein